MQFIIALCDEIVIPPNRQRQEFEPEALMRLTESIEKTGLLHPIIVREVEGQWTLVAGERRLRAIKMLHDLGTPFNYAGELVPVDCIIASDFTCLDPLQAREAELDENIHRADLTWQERAKAVEGLKSLRTEQAFAAGLSLPTVADIAKEVRGSSEGINQENTRQELIVARHLDNPEVAGAKTVNEAFKILKRKENLQRHEHLAKEVGTRFHSGLHKLHNGDILEAIDSVPSNHFDVILTDPPYGIDADEFGDCGGKATGGAHLYNDSYLHWLNLMAVVIKESFRVAKPHAHCYMFCDLTRFFELKDLMEEAGWKVFRTPLIWHKPNGNRIPWVDRGPQRQYEVILYATKGDRLVLKHGSDVLTFRQDQNLGHQAQKPVELFRELLSRSAHPGDKVLDLFCGTGPIFPAAHSLKVEATGFEISPAAYGIAVVRIKELV